MRERERHMVGSMVALMLLLWLSFLVHRDPSFAGSFTGTMIGITAAVFMLGEFFYFAAKRLPTFRSWVTQRVSMRSLLTWHIYGGILGPILAIVHSSHRYDSTLGTLLLTLLILNVLCGFVGRYLYNQVATEIREKQELQAGLRIEYTALSKTLGDDPRTELTRLGENMGLITSLSYIPSRNFAHDDGAKLQLLRVIDALSDVDYSIRAHDKLKVWFNRCMQLHLALSLAVLGLLIAHIWAELYVGLRWL